MATITTSTQASNFAYPSQSVLARSPLTGNLAVLVRLTSGELRLYQSTNNGTSWTDTGAGFNRANLQEWSSLRIDTDGFVHVAYRVYESGQDRIYYRRAGLVSGTLTWDSELLVSAVNAGGAGSVYTGVDIVTIKSLVDDSYQTFVAVGTTSGGNIGVSLFVACVYIEYDNWYGSWYWVYHTHNALVSGTKSWFVAGSGRVTPSIDFRHNGDGHNGDIPDLWIAWGRVQTCIVRLPYSGGQWTGTAGFISLTTPPVAMDHNPGRFDGSRFLVPSINGTSISVYERDLSNTVTNVRVSPAHTTGVVRYVAISYAPQTGDFRLYAVGTSTAVLYQIDYVRATNTWGAWTSTGLTIVNVNNFGVRRSAYGNARYDLYTQTGSSPFTLSGTHSLLAFAPDTPAWVTPTSGSAQDVAKQLTLTWAFSDPNPGDTQASYALSRQIGAGTVQYWRASDSTWQATEQQNVSGSSFVTLAAGWGADADAEHNYRVKTWDAGGLSSGYSSAMVIIPSTPITPVITTPSTTSTPVMADSFTRSGNLSGSTPDVLAVGAATWGLLAGSATVFTTDGSKLISAPAVSSASANINYALNYNNPVEFSYDVKVSTLASAVATRDFTIFIRQGTVSGGNFIGLALTISAAGVPSMFFRKTTSAGSLAPWGANLDVNSIIPSNTAKGVTYSFKFGVVGNVVYASINGITLGARYLTAAEVASLGGQFQFRTTNTAGTPSLDIEIDNFAVNGQTMATFTGPTVRAEWVATNQTAFRVRLYNVTTDTPVLENDSGWQTSTVTGYTFPVALSDLNYYNMLLEVRNSEGLTSTAVERTFYVDYTEPTTPTYTVSPNPGAGAIILNITNPKNTGSQPAIQQNNIYRREIGDTSIGTKIAVVNQSTFRTNLFLYDANDRESIESANFGWNSNNGTIQPINRDNAQALDGTWSLRLVNTAGGTPFPGVFTTPANNMPALPNTTYTLSYWARASGGSRALSAVVNARSGSDGSGNLGNIAGAPTVTSQSGVWTQFSWTFTTPALTTFLTVSIGTSSTNAGVGEAHYLDRMELYKADDVGSPVAYSDFTAKHGVPYEYRVQAVGTNGAVTYGAWVS